MFKTLFIFFTLISAHYLSSNLYAYYCTPWCWNGFFTSILQIESVKCKVLRWTFGYSYEHIQAFWILLTAYLIKTITDIISKVK
jgi:hypothetical protein